MGGTARTYHIVPSCSWLDRWTLIDALARILRRLLILFSILALALGVPAVQANPVGDFFKNVGRTLSKFGKSSPAPKKTRKSSATSRKEAAEPESRPPTPIATPAPTPIPMEVRPATSAAPSGEQARDVPYGVVVPDRPGLVKSPYAPSAGLVDVRAFPSSTEVMDPFTGKIFLTP